MDVSQIGHRAFSGLGATLHSVVKVYLSATPLGRNRVSMIRCGDFASLNELCDSTLKALVSE